MGSPRQVFKKKVLAASVAALASVSYSAVAQEAPVEEVLVTGIRASLENAMDIKRESSGVVDAISAEDIGKMPDSNLAESLQRITGISIDRSNGEGSRVTARGIGPDFNLVTLNGRNMPGTTSGMDFQANGRSFDFANIASEGVSGIEVYKTSKANVASGGIGATINIKTARPLDKPGLAVSLGGKAVHDTTSNDNTPELSGIYSQTFMDDKFGVAISGSYQERSSARTDSLVNQWNQNEWNREDRSGTPFETATVINEPETGQKYFMPSDLRYLNIEQERERINGQLVLQFAPNEDLTFTADVTAAQNDISETREQQSIWFQQNASYVEFDTANSAATPVVYSETVLDNQGNPSSKDYAMAQNKGAVTNELASVGFNVDWIVSDSLSFVLDVHSSTGEITPNLGGGLSFIDFGMAGGVAHQQTADFRGDLPTIALDQIVDCDDADDLRCNGQFDINDVGSQWMQLYYSEQKTDINEFQLSGAWESDLVKLDFGVSSRITENNTKFSNNQLKMGDWGVTQPGDVPNMLLSPRNISSGFEDYSPGSSGRTDADNTPIEVFPLTFAGDAEALAMWGAEEYGHAYGPKAALDTNRTIEEETFGAFLMGTFSWEAAGMPMNLVAGIRYEDTTTTATNDLAVPTSIVWTADNDFTLNRGAEQPFAREGQYDNVLPSLDFDVEFMDGLIGRLSYGQTIAPVSYEKLDSAIAVNAPTRMTELNGTPNANVTAGNPELLPLKSTNLDVSLEWYFDDSSYVSVGYFTKDVENFTQQINTVEGAFGLQDVTLGGTRSDAGVAFLTACGLGTTEKNRFAATAAQDLYDPTDTSDAGCDAFAALDLEQIEADYDVAPIASDPEQMFNTTTPENIDDKSVDGFEIAVQYFLGETGFGFAGSYTDVSGDVNFDVDNYEQQFALVGISDTANASFIYENYGVSARLTYNWRDKFLDNTARYNDEPSFTEAYKQVDFNLGYEVTDQLDIFFEGLNINSENKRQHGRTDRQLWRLEEYGARYNLGFRWAL